MTDELKPVRCGCGREAEVHVMGHEMSDAQYYIKCEKCDTRTWFFDSEAEAVKTWNKAMGELTAKVEWSEVDGCHLCGNCGYAVNPHCEVYCAGCGARLEWE